MGSTFETIVIAVALIGVILSFTRHFWPFRAAQDLGRIGGAWFDHEEDLDLEKRADANRNDPPIPQRRLRGRG